MRLSEGEYNALIAGRRDKAIEQAQAFVPDAKPKAIDKPKRKGALLGVVLSMPIKIISEANNRDHWTEKRKRGTSQKQEFEVEWYRLTRGLKIEFPCVVTLIRLGPRKLDDDNLANGFKKVRDTIAALLGVDDGRDDLIQFKYAQHDKNRYYSVKIVIERVIGVE